MSFIELAPLRLTPKKTNRHRWEKSIIVSSLNLSAKNISRLTLVRKSLVTFVRLNYLASLFVQAAWTKDAQPLDLFHLKWDSAINGLEFVWVASAQLIVWQVIFKSSYVEPTHFYVLCVGFNFTSRLKKFWSQVISLSFYGPKLILLFTKAGWSTHPYSINFRSLLVRRSFIFWPWNSLQEGRKTERTDLLIHGFIFQSLKFELEVCGLLGPGGLFHKKMQIKEKTWLGKFPIWRLCQASIFWFSNVWWWSHLVYSCWQQATKSDP